jgi:hypothetical protein
MYKPPDRKILSKKHVPELYGQYKTVIDQDISAREFVSLSTDGWTDTRKHAFVNTMVHGPPPLLFKNEDTELNAHTGWTLLYHFIQL